MQFFLKSSNLYTKVSVHQPNVAFIAPVSPIPDFQDFQGPTFFVPNNQDNQSIPLEEREDLRGLGDSLSYSNHISNYGLLEVMERGHCPAR